MPAKAVSDWCVLGTSAIVGSELGLAYASSTRQPKQFANPEDT